MRKAGGLCFQSVDGGVGGDEAKQQAMRPQIAGQRFRCFDWCNEEALSVGVKDRRIRKVLPARG